METKPHQAISVVSGVLAFLVIAVVTIPVFYDWVVEEWHQSEREQYEREMLAFDVRTLLLDSPYLVETLNLYRRKAAEEDLKFSDPDNWSGLTVAGGMRSLGELAASMDFIVDQLITGPGPGRKQDQLVEQLKDTSISWVGDVVYMMGYRMEGREEFFEYLTLTREDFGKLGHPRGWAPGYSKEKVALLAALLSVYNREKAPEKSNAYAELYRLYKRPDDPMKPDLAASLEGVPEGYK